MPSGAVVQILYHMVIDMLARERQNQIEKILNDSGAVTASKLMNVFGVSIETIRRDLLEMERNGLLHRVHGGAISVQEMPPFHSLAVRTTEHMDEKEELASYALNFVNEGDYIGIDSGSTAVLFAQALKSRFHKLTVVTHCLSVFETLHTSSEFHLILCGGDFFSRENAFYGTLTLDMLNSLRLQKVFLFPAAISLNYGICDYAGELCPVQKCFIKNSDSVYVLADNSKFEKKALFKLDDMRPEYTYITDRSLSAELYQLYQENNLRVSHGGCI